MTTPESSSGSFSGSSSPEPIKSEDFWFDDGDIVLSATDDDDEYHFRVHRVILTIASPVFREMLSMPQPKKGNISPVFLNDDSVEDLEALLGVLYCTRLVDPQSVYKDLTHSSQERHRKSPFALHWESCGSHTNIK